MWLWRARFFKTRSLSASFISRKGIRLTRGEETRKVTKPALRLVPGDIVSVPLRTHIVTVRVLETGMRRGPASEARGLYERMEEKGGTESDA